MSGFLVQEHCTYLDDDIHVHVVGGYNKDCMEFDLALTLKMLTPMTAKIRRARKVTSNTLPIDLMEEIRPVTTSYGEWGGERNLARGQGQMPSARS